MKEFSLICVMIFVCLIGIGFASYDATPRPKASPDLAEFIIKTPTEVYIKHGYSERTDILYNLARFKELYIESAQQIKMLTDRVTKLENKVDGLGKPPVPVAIDPNDIE